MTNDLVDRRPVYEPLENFDKVAENKDEAEDASKYVYKRVIVWRNIVLMTFLHVASIYGFITLTWDPAKTAWAFLIIEVIGRLSGFGVTAGAHRLWAHRSYKARLPLRIALMIMHTMAMQDDLYQWCRDHRLHHKHSDTNADPYNARRGFFFSHIGWLMVRKHRDVIVKGKQIKLDDVWADPVVRFQRRFYIPLVLIFWGALPTYIFHRLTGIGIGESFLGACLFRYMFTLHYSWLVNSAAHLYGYQMYDKSLEPRENRFVIYAAMGEGYHNYHHTFPWDYSASELGWERNFNITTMFIDTCAWLGLAYDRRKPDPGMIDARASRTGDQATRKSFIWGANLVWDYFLGFLVSYWVLIFSLSMRYYLNGHV